MSRTDEAFRMIDTELSGQIEQLMRTLISLESHSQREGCEREMVRFLSEEFSRIGCSVQIREPASGRPNVIAELTSSQYESRGRAAGAGYHTDLGGRVPPEGAAAQDGGDRGRGGRGTEVKGPVLMFNGHTDTVPAPTWNRGNPYQAVIDEGIIYGRGAADMKGPICSVLIAFKAVSAVAGAALKGKAVFTGVAGEEGSGSLGTCDIIRNGPPADMVVVCEPTNLQIGLSQKGFANFEVVIRGKAAHSGSPQEGTNALSLAAILIDRHTRCFPETFSRYSDSLLGEPTLTPVTITGGGRADTVPDECRIKFNCRYMPTMDVQDVEDYLRNLADEVCRPFPCSTAEVTREIRYVPWDYPERWTYSGSPFQTSTDSLLVKAMKEAVKKAVGTEPGYFGAGYWSDAGLFGASGHTPTVLYGPGRMEVAHGYEENITVADITTAAKVYAALVLNLCG